MKKTPWVYFLTLGSIGYLPAPGTLATIFSLFVIMLFNIFKFSVFTYLGILITFFLISFYSIKKCLFYFGTFNNDPREIVVDEMLGTFITFAFVPFNLFTALLGFLLFRFFDIVKPFGIKKLEKFDKYLSILLDDIAAGLISNFILQLVLLYV